MTLENKHPYYTAMFDTWQKMADAYSGEDAIKEQGTDYLPATSAMSDAGMQSANAPGFLAYEAYKTRASYPELVRWAVETLLGSMWVKGPVIELPTALEYMMQTASIDGEGLEQLLLKINEAQLTAGGIGLLLDIAVDSANNKGLPYIAMYPRTSITNWNEGQRQESDIRRTLNLVVLNEAEQVMDETDFTWKQQQNWRVLKLEGDESATPVYQVAAVIASNEFNPADLITPSIRGKKLDTIPFVAINTKDLLIAPDVPPLKPLANKALTIYRGEADYRQNLFMQAQDTLVIIGDTDDKPVRIGATAVIKLPNGPGADAKFIGVNAAGLDGQRTALDDDRKHAAAMSGQLLDTVSRERESEDALNTRIGAKTASLRQIVKIGAAGLERLLKLAAIWIGANPDDVKVTPNYDFSDIGMKPDDLVKLMTAKGLGAPLSIESIHNIMTDKGMTELTFEEELEKIQAEIEQIPETKDDNPDDNPADTTTGGA